MTRIYVGVRFHKLIWTSVTGEISVNSEAITLRLHIVARNEPELFSWLFGKGIFNTSG